MVKIIQKVNPKKRLEEIISEIDDQDKEGYELYLRHKAAIDTLTTLSITSKKKPCFSSKKKKKRR